MKCLTHNFAERCIYHIKIQFKFLIFAQYQCIFIYILTIWTLDIYCVTMYYWCKFKVCYSNILIVDWIEVNKVKRPSFIILTQVWSRTCMCRPLTNFNKLKKLNWTFVKRVMALSKMTSIERNVSEKYNIFMIESHQLFSLQGTFTGYGISPFKIMFDSQEKEDVWYSGLFNAKISLCYLDIINITKIHKLTRQTFQFAYVEIRKVLQMRSGFKIYHLKWGFCDLSKLQKLAMMLP